MIIILVGAPGSGKGTVAERIQNKYEFPIVSSGEILRNEMKQETAIGKQVLSYVSSGKLVPDRIITALIKQKISKHQHKCSVVLDGYPRNLNQSLALEDITQTKQRVFYLDVPKDILKERLINRGRTDDTEKVIEQRFEVFLNETRPILDYYKRRDTLVRISGTSSDEIFRKIDALLSK
ncbi:MULTISPECIES: adenylate kinase family protein [Carnobacteriaceae]|uniref:Adenylate kinase n=3 Tax=Carnobacteriaceae TaxID=186828 RepID=A0A1H7VHU4_9LACT|nr:MULTISPECIES: nucleoside monophosphate kinase [Carnobacteriaceae]API90095.1 hypothetical protein BKP56_12885 [Marinilactibacillus sp. 15R]GEK89824.1 adenylate kinase [Alkalibacterium putridalgicola]SEM08624.1 Adenylate kinase [Alkalibacterium putridalgicola]SFK49356.1 Adenylate kinase [Marinilactibacillus piezotolerans]